MLSGGISLLASSAKAGDADEAEVVTDKVFFEVSVDGKPLGKVVIGLFGNTVPKTVANFKALCKGFKKDNGSGTLTYAGSPFHRIIPDFMIQVV